MVQMKNQLSIGWTSGLSIYFITHKIPAPEDRSVDPWGNFGESSDI